LRVEVLPEARGSEEAEKDGGDWDEHNAKHGASTKNKSKTWDPGERICSLACLICEALLWRDALLIVNQPRLVPSPRSTAFFVTGTANHDPKSL
jgi:hypothetical protein